MTYSDYKHIIPIQVRFADVDRLNHVNNACYLSYFELGRVKYFNQVLVDAIHWDKQGFILARTEIDHKVPVFLNDEVYCCTRVTTIGNKSLTIKNSILKKQNDQLIECAAGIGILVAMNYTDNLSMPVPEAWRRLMLDFEK